VVGSFHSYAAAEIARVRVSSRYVREWMPVSLESIGAIDTADEPLARSTVADAEEHAVFNSIPEESDFDPVALAERELVQRLERLWEHELRLTYRPPRG
jgi:hypothetical protein